MAGQVGFRRIQDREDVAVAEIERGIAVLLGGVAERVGLAQKARYSGQVELVLAGEILDRVMAVAGDEVEGVGTFSPGQLVGALAAVELVLAAVAEELVVAGTADELAPLGDAVTGSLGASPFVSLLFGLDFEDPSGGSLTKIVVPWEGLNSEGHGTIRGHFLPSAGGVSGKVDSIEISIGSKSVFEVTFKPGITVKASLLNALDDSDESDLSPIVNLLSKSPSEFSGSSGNDFAVLFNANDVLHGNGGNDHTSSRSPPYCRTIGMAPARPWHGPRQ